MDLLFPGCARAQLRLSGRRRDSILATTRRIEAQRARRQTGRRGLTRWLARLGLALQHRARPRRAHRPVCGRAVVPPFGGKVERCLTTR
jgi:hypothetical protein